MNFFRGQGCYRSNRVAGSEINLACPLSITVEHSALTSLNFSDLWLLTSWKSLNALLILFVFPCFVIKQNHGCASGVNIRFDAVVNVYFFLLMNFYHCCFSLVHNSGSLKYLYHCGKCIESNFFTLHPKGPILPDTLFLFLAAASGDNPALYTAL